ncbi:MAG: rhamnogalacturonan lyase [Prevotella sp.]|nr:rhamnogalacturonan lyase [Prevotella sp.]
MRRIFLILMGCQLAVGSLMAQYTPTSQQEKLDRGLVALPRTTGSGVFLSWRLLGTDNVETTTFDIVRDGTTIQENVTKTNYEDVAGTKTASYQIVTKVNGDVVETSEAVTPWQKVFCTLTLDRPAKGAQGGTYTPNDMSVGDVDGDGQYELFVKWDPSTSKDNSQSGVTDNVYIDCYKLDGTRLWRIDLGRNIRAGAHYTQFMVYDFDGDGQAEMMCKTAPGSIDGAGKYVNEVATDETIKSASATKVYLNSDGRVVGGQEWLTVFKGMTGEAIHTIFYNPNRNMTYGGAADGSTNWGQAEGKNDAASYGNRGERFLGAVAYLDGADKPACGVFCRGYYGYAFIWAVGFDGQHLHQKWLSQHKSKTSYILYTYNEDDSRTSKAYTKCQPTSGSGSGTMFGNGNHNMCVADVDGDGCDEIIWGSAALDHDGRLLYGTGFGHGDAIHMGAMMPSRPGLQVFEVHEEKGTYSWDLHDACTGEIIYKGGNAGIDNGRGMAADIDASSAGWEFWSSDERHPRSAETGQEVIGKNPSVNFRIYWDGDVQDELFDGRYDSSSGIATPQITKWSGSSFTTLREFGSSYGHPQTCNTTKSTPSLQADLLGDWREELVMWNYDNPAEIHIYTTNITSKYSIPTLMHDHTYRMGICWQNTAYNQPPHLGYYLPDYVAGRPNAIQDVAGERQSDAIVVYDLQGRRISPDGHYRGVAIERKGVTTRKVVIE